jgi:hypothetical protein
MMVLSSSSEMEGGNLGLKGLKCAEGDVKDMPLPDVMLVVAELIRCVLSIFAAEG